VDTYNYVLDVSFTVGEVVDDFLEVLEHEVLVGKQLLVVVEGADLVLSYVLTLLRDGHRIVVDSILNTVRRKNILFTSRIKELLHQGVV
jgi:hypothetical protein